MNGHVKFLRRSQGFPEPGIWLLRAMLPRPNGKSSWQAVVVATVSWKLRLILGPGTSIGRFSCGLGLLLRDLEEWRHRFCTEFRCAPRERKWFTLGNIFGKSYSGYGNIQFGKMGLLNIFSNYFSIKSLVVCLKT